MAGSLPYCPQVTSCPYGHLTNRNRSDASSLRRSAFGPPGVRLRPRRQGGCGRPDPAPESARFQQRAAAATTDQAKARFEMYSQASCEDDGLPHLIVDGRWSHAGDFVYPGIMFLYVAGCIGWAGREYLKATRGKNAAMNEIQIDLSLPSKSSCCCNLALGSLWWFTSGKLLEDDNKVTVSPR